MSYSLIAHGIGLITTNPIDTTGADLLVVSTSGGAETLTDSKSNTWTPITAYGPGGATPVSELWYVRGGSVGAAHTFTANVGGFSIVAVSAFSGSAISPLDQETGGFTGAGTTSRQNGLITPSENNELIVSMLSLSGDTSNTAIDSGFTLTDSMDAIAFVEYGGAMAYIIQTTAAAVDPTWSWTSSQKNSGAVATFKAAAVASTAAQRRLLYMKMGR